MSKWFLPLTVGFGVVFLVAMSAALEYQRQRHSHHIPTEVEQ